MVIIILGIGRNTAIENHHYLKENVCPSNSSNSCLMQFSPATLNQYVNSKITCIQIVSSGPVTFKTLFPVMCMLLTKTLYGPEVEIIIAFAVWFIYLL